MLELNEIRQATMTGDQSQVVKLTKQAIRKGIDPNNIIQDGFITAMGAVGDKFSTGKIYVPEMLRAARAMKQGLELVKPLLIGKPVKTLAKVVVGTVKGDMHDIGKNLVAIMFEGSGFEVVDLGVDVSPEQIVEAVGRHQPQVVGLSALLTTTMSSMEETIQCLQEAGLREAVKVLVGGAPVRQKFADEIGADGYAQNAAEAVNRVKELLV